MTKSEEKRGINKSVIIPLIISILLPLLSILLPIYTSTDGYTYKLGLPLNFFYFYGTGGLPTGLGILNGNVLSKQVSFQTLLYTLNVLICYFVIYLVRTGIMRMKGK